MTILDRPTIVDRPELVNRDNQEDEEDVQAAQETEALGEGGGPTLHGLEFEKGDYELVAASNVAAVLSTGKEGPDSAGDSFTKSFRNAAIQLYELQESGESIDDIVRFSIEKGVAEIGLNSYQLDELLDGGSDDKVDESVEPDEADGQDEKASEKQGEDEEQDGDEDIEQVEESIEEVKSEESTDEETEDEEG